MLDRLKNGDNPWRLRGTALQVAWFVAAVFAAAAALMAAVDLYSNPGWGSPVLQAWTLVPQMLVVIGLFVLGRTRGSTAFMVLAGLVGLIVIEEAFHVLNPVAAWLARIARWANQWSDVRLSVLNGVLIYGLVALVGLTLLAVSHWRGSATERPVVRNIALLLLAGGFFGGPVSTLSTMGHRRRWIFIEEFGEAIVFALMAGYVAGLVIALLPRSSDRSAGMASRRFLRREHP